MKSIIRHLYTVNLIFLLVCFAGCSHIIPFSGFPHFQRQDLAFDLQTLKYNPCNDVMFPSVIKAEGILQNPLGTYYMYYAPHDPPGGICLAYSDSLKGPWKEYPRNPLISRAWESHFDVSHVSSPHALWIAGEQKLFLWFHGENNITRYATTVDGIHFNYEGIAVSSDDFDELTECSYARVFKYDIPEKKSRFIMMLMGNHNGTRGIYLAFSPDARKWKTKKDMFIPPPVASQGQTCAPWLFPWKKQLFVLHHACFERLGGIYSIYATKIDFDFENIHPKGDFFIALDKSPENGRVASPCFISEGGKTYMFYDAGKRCQCKIACAIND